MRRLFVVPHRPRFGQGGSTVVEFAVVFPLFFLLVASAIEGGRFVVCKMMLSYAVSVGARAATLSTASSDSVQSAVVNSAPMLHLNTTQVEITPTALPVAVNTNVTVSIGVVDPSNKYQFISLIPPRFSPFSSRGWAAQATMIAR